jgi:dihydroorotate dehydrogenase (fumarate)
MDLTTKYLDLNLDSPIVASASPITKSLDGIYRLADGQPSAIVLHSLFEEQINATSREMDHYMSSGTESFGEALTYFPEIESFEVGPDLYLEHLRQASEEIDIPIIASLNGTSRGGWVNYAKMMEEAGASAIELNIYYLNTNPDLTGNEVEDKYLNVVRNVLETVSIPVAVKLSPFFSSLPNMCRRLAGLGAKGFVLFNRFYQPDLDIDNLEIVHDLKLSTSDSLRLPLRWIAMMYSRVDTDFAISSGVHNGRDVIKGVMAGANVTMMTAEILQNGIKRFAEVKQEVANWMEENEYESIGQMRGSLSQKNSPDPSAYERANYMKVLQSIRQDPTGQLW